MIALPAAIMASGFAENIRTRKQRYNLHAHRFLDDGIIDEIEHAQLEELRRELGLDSDEALQLLQEMMQKIDDRRTTKCPHCGAAID